MSTRKLSFDTRVANCVKQAKALIKDAPKTTLLEAFQAVTQKLRAESDSTLLRYPFSTSEEEFDAENQKLQIQTIRLDLEESLLELDSHCANGTKAKITWPTADRLAYLSRLAKNVTRLTATKEVVRPWDSFQGIDRLFPKLQLQKRIVGFTKRITDCIPPRPMGTLVSSTDSEPNELLKQFFTDAKQHRNGSLGARRVDWQKYSQFLIRYQDWKCRQANRPARGQLWIPEVDSAKPDAQAYIAFLLLERDDLSWLARYWHRILPVLFWIQELGAPDLIMALGQFFPGTVSYSRASIAGHDAAQNRRKRELARDRQAKSRKSRSKKRDTSRSSSL